MEWMEKKEFAPVLGTSVLVLCSTDMSENSYYGDTMLQHLNRNGDSSNIQLSRSQEMSVSVLVRFFL